MKKYIILFLQKCLRWLDTEEQNSYTENKNHLIPKILEDDSRNILELDIRDFYESHGLSTTKELYNILNRYYNSVLANNIIQEDSNAISKLKFLLEIILELRNILDTNNK